VEKLLQQNISANTKLKLPKNSLLLGDLSSVYNDFILSYRRYDQLRLSELYVTMRKTLHGKNGLKVYI